MPHVIVKLYSGRTEEQKAKLAEEVCNAVISALACDEKSVSVAIQDIRPADWQDKVYKPDILANSARIYKKPAY
ncbi:tautomerase family protein [Rhodoferax sediminis]|uniref:4-oxalocrotonate tautomerase n=1 Tax=Rhodoferax sediminis TaxID=2509614 RepID=A0A515DEA4_9BURK|nr:tautomerase family protein [Rhodoferax sediminis]QDL38700.1 4-oxalocrotonate tautomerase [Rhodoferax sediminis]